MAELDPSKILQVGLGYWGSKTLLSAVELGLFTELARQPMTGKQVEAKLELHPRATYDFLDTLLAMGSLKRDGDGRDAVYRNTDETQVFLDRESDRYIGEMLEMTNARQFAYWNDLTEGLRTGKQQNEVKHTGESIFQKLYADPAELERFMNAMTGISMGNFHAFAQKFDFSPHNTMCDVGGATGTTVDHLRTIQYALAVHELRPTGRRTHCPKEHRRRRAKRPHQDRRRRLFYERLAQGRPHHHEHDPARLELGEEDAPGPVGLRRAAPRGDLRGHREPHR